MVLEIKVSHGADLAALCPLFPKGLLEMQELVSGS
jgi:hypothetical protein